MNQFNDQADWEDIDYITKAEASDPLAIIYTLLGVIIGFLFVIVFTVVALYHMHSGF